MSYPASTVPLDRVLMTVDDQANALKLYAQQSIAALGSTVDSNWVFGFLDTMRARIAQLNAAAAVSGIAAYAQAQKAGYTGNIVTDFTTMVNAVQACINWVVSNFPKDSTATYILAYVLNSDGSRTPATFTSAATAPLRTLLQAVDQAIS